MIEFSKAHACGNDFLIVEEGRLVGRDPAALARALCARTTGIGADGVEFLERRGDREGRIRLYNADGSIAELSGNGTRCVAAWMAFRAGLVTGDEVRLETDAGLRTSRIESAASHQFHISTGMGVPRVTQGRVTLASGIEVSGAVVSMGNPHFVVVVADDTFRVQGMEWQAGGAAICTHADFPAQTNVEFVRSVAQSEIEIRIYERGVGPTLSSGTGASASAAAMVAFQGAPARLRVRSPGGEQMVEWVGGESELRLTGPAVVLADGRWLGGDEP